MSYQAGKQTAKKHNYHIFVKAYYDSGGKPQPETRTQVLALTNQLSYLNFSSEEINTELYSSTDLTKVSHIYKISTQDIDGNFDFQVSAPTGTEEDIMVLQLIDNQGATYQCDITDEKGNLDTLKGIGDLVVMVYRGGTWQILGKYTSLSDPNIQVPKNEEVYSFREIGICEASPNIAASEGEEQTGNWGDSITISENLEISIVDLQVNKDNYLYLRDLRNYSEGFVTFLFMDFDNVDNPAFRLRKMPIKVLPEFTGNALNKLNLTASKEIDDVDKYFDVIGYM